MRSLIDVRVEILLEGCSQRFTSLLLKKHYTVCVLSLLWLLSSREAVSGWRSDCEGGSGSAVEPFRCCAASLIADRVRAMAFCWLRCTTSFLVPPLVLRCS